MHSNNNLTMADWKSKHPDSFHHCKVLELGSLYVNGTIRPHFTYCEYIGIDKQAGWCVDIAVEAKNTKFELEYFDTIVSFSMFEHDPDWKESLKHNLQWLKPEGMLFLLYGAEGNRPHFCGGVHIIIPHKEFLAYMEELGLEILEAYFEDDKFGVQCPGAFNILAKKYK